MNTTIDMQKPTTTDTENVLKDAMDAIVEYQKPKAFLLGGVAAVAIGAALLSGEKGNEQTPQPDAEYSVTFSNVETISKGDTPINAAERAVDGIDPSSVDLAKLQQGAMDSAEALRNEGHIVQPGDTVHVKIGELDGEPDQDRQYGTDVGVTINPAK